MARGLRICSFWILGHRLSSCGVLGLTVPQQDEIFPHQGSNPCFLLWQDDSLH